MCVFVLEMMNASSERETARCMFELERNKEERKKERKKEREREKQKTSHTANSI